MRGSGGVAPCGGPAGAAGARSLTERGGSRHEDSTAQKGRRGGKRKLESTREKPF